VFEGGSAQEINSTLLQAVQPSRSLVQLMRTIQPYCGQFSPSECIRAVSS